MATCPHKSSKEWKDLVLAQGVEMAHYLWDKHEGVVPDSYNKSLNDQLIDGFLKDFNITATEYSDLQEDLGLNAYTASDLIAKAIAYKKGQSLTPEVVYFAYQLLGVTPNNEKNTSINSKIRSDLRYLISKWDKFDARFNHHKNEVQKKFGYIDDKGIWLAKVRDLVVLDFLRDSLYKYYLDPQEFTKSLDTKWTKDDFNIWKSIIDSIESLLNAFGLSLKSKKQNVDKLQNIGLSIADEILNRNYEYFDFELSDKAVQKDFNESINSDLFAKKLVDFGQHTLGLILTGSLALRRVGSVYRTIEESLHDIDWVVPFNKISEINSDIVNKIKEANERFKLLNSSTREINLFTRELAQTFDFFKKFKEEYPSLTVFNGFYGAEHQDNQSYTLQAVVDGEFYDHDGIREEEKVRYGKKDGKTVEIKYKQSVYYAKGDLIPNTGYIVDFFIRLEPNQDEHENYFKLWKEIMIAKLLMNRPKDLKDWKAFIPFTKSSNEFNFNYSSFRHLNYENIPSDALEDTHSDINESIEDQVKDREEPIYLEQSESNSPEYVERKTINKIKGLLKRLDIPIDPSLEESLGVNGLADLLNKVIKVVKGEIGEKALPEEAMHFIVAAIKDKYPSLYSQMEKEIWKYNIYNDTLRDYKDNLNYQKDGRPDIAKLKEEAIGKLLAGIIINRDLEETSNLIDVSKKWWVKVLEALKQLFSKIDSNPFEDPFESTATNAFKDNFILPADIKNLSQATSFLQMGVPDPEKQKKLFDKLTEDMSSKRYKKVQIPGNRHYEIDGKIYYTSVTDTVKQKIDKKFNFGERSESEKFKDSFSAFWGNTIDDTLTHILERYVDSTTGLIRNVPEERPKKADGSFDLSATPMGVAEITARKLKNPTVAKLEMYNTLESFISEFLKTFPPNTRFMWQVIVANTNAKKILPGTIDFLAIQEDVSVKIYDWKSINSEFFDVSANKIKSKEDIAFFKQEAWNIQIEEYRKMFTDSSSVYARHLDTKVKSRKDKRFNIEVVESRAIPISVAFTRKKINPAIKSWVDNTVYDLSKVQIGSPDWSNTLRFLKPVPTSTEKTYVKELDGLILIIDKIYSDLYSKRYTTKRDREAKNRELNRLKEAKRDIQVNKHIKTTLNSFILTLNRLNRELPNSDFILIRHNLQTLSNLYGIKENLEELFATVSIDKRKVEADLSVETDPLLKTILQNKLNDINEHFELYDKLSDVDKNINLLISQYRERNKEQIKTLSEKLGLRNIFSLQRQIGGSLSLERLFNGKSEIYIKTVQVFNKLLGDASTSSKYEYKDVYDKLVKARKDLRKWAEENGKTTQEALNLMLTSKSVLGEELKFLAKWKKDFYSARGEALNKLSGEEDQVISGVEWFLANTEFDEDAFNEEKLNQIDLINDEEFDVDPILNAKAKKEAIEDWEKKNNININGVVNKEAFNVKNKFLQPINSWKTDQYIYLEDNLPLWNAYTLFRNIIKEAEESGQIERWLFNRSLPNMPSLIFLGTKEIPGKMAISMINSIYKEDNPMNTLDSLGYEENKIKINYTKDLGVWRERVVEEDGVKKVNPYKDYSNVSTDLFTVFSNFAESSITAKNLSNIEDASLLLYDYEMSKTHTLPRTKFGNIIEDREGIIKTEAIKEGENKNAAFLHKFISHDLYKDSDEEDTSLGIYKASKFVEKQIKKINGGEEFLEDLKSYSKHLSLKSLILALNSFNQLSVLAGNINSAIANFVVGNVNVWFAAGSSFTYADTLPPTNVKDIRKFLALVDYVLPGIEFKYSAKSKSGKPQIMGSFLENKKDFGLITAIGETDIQRALYSLMRYTDQAVQYSVYLGMLRNHMVDNGSIINIDSYAKSIKYDINGSSYDYADRFDLSESDRNLLEKKIKEKVEFLKESSSLLTTAKLITNSDETVGIEFDGIERNSPTVKKFRTSVQEVIKDVLGSITEEDSTMIRMSWYGAIVMTFKNWMPRQIRIRFGKFNYNSNTNTYNASKYGILWRDLKGGLKTSDGKIHLGIIPTIIGDLLGANYYLKQFNIISKYGRDKAISDAYDFYAEELYKRGDVDSQDKANDEMPTLSEFSDMYNHKLESSFKELRVILLLAVTSWAYAAYNDPKDESSWEIAIITAINRVLFDLTFWSPNSWYNVLKSPFAFLGEIETITHLIEHGWKYMLTGKNSEANLTRKYLYKSLPVSRAYLNIRSLFDDRFRRKYNIQQKSYNF